MILTLKYNFVIKSYEVNHIFNPRSDIVQQKIIMDIETFLGKICSFPVCLYNAVFCIKWHQCVLLFVVD